MHGYFSDKAFKKAGGMVFLTPEGKEITVTTDSDVQDPTLGRYVGLIGTFVGYKPSPDWVNWDPTYRNFINPNKA